MASTPRLVMVSVTGPQIEISSVCPGSSQLVFEVSGAAGMAIVVEPAPSAPLRVSDLVISSCSVYLPGQTSILAPLAAAATACLTVLKLGSVQLLPFSTV